MRSDFAESELPEVRMNALRRFALTILALSTKVFCAGAGPETQGLVPHDTRSVLFQGFMRSEVLGLVAGFGTTFAALPDLIAMFRRRSSVGMNPRMATILGAFQILWVYYGFLIGSRPVIVWNIIAVLVNFVSVSAYFYFMRKEKHAGATTKNSANRA
jgi:MtN3 and saliva related transmembrane protein